MILKFDIIILILIVVGIAAVLRAVSSYKNNIFSYEFIYYVGFTFFTVIQLVPMLYIRLFRLNSTTGVGVEEIKTFLAGSNFNFMIFSIPFIVIFAVLMLISNIELMRHEGRRPINMLGIFVGLVMVAGWLFIVIVDINFSGSDTQFRNYALFCGIYSTVYAYMECMLLGSIVSNMLAGRKKTVGELDGIIILGCRVRKDGSLTPLLKGRCDRALQEYKEQLQKYSKAPYLIASGGKGDDEVIAEGEAMAVYLRENGIPEDKILIEAKSKNTFENMSFSKDIIVKNIIEPKIAFSTSSYHVFRSGIIASEAGLKVQGVGARTKWYFWPNAFVREFAGLMVRGFVRQVIVMTVMTIIFIILMRGLI